MQSTPSLHATLEAIIRFPHDPLSADEAGLVLNRDGATISAACKSKQITTTAANFRGRCNQRSYRITKSNLIAWLWKNEQGDKAILRAAMQDLCPKILRALEPHATPMKRPSNVLDFEHPDLFAAPAPQKQPA